MKLSQKQFEFAKKLSLLLVWLVKNGYYFTLGDGRCTVGHKKNSLHYDGLAQDINLFTPQGALLEETDDHVKPGEYWESIGGTWGGRFGDGNHYSVEWNGRK